MADFGGQSRVEDHAIRASFSFELSASMFLAIQV